MTPRFSRRFSVMRFSARFATLAACLLSPALALAQAAPPSSNSTGNSSGTLPPGLGSLPGSSAHPQGSVGNGQMVNNRKFKQLRLDDQSGGMNSYVRVGPSVNNQGGLENPTAAPAGAGPTRTGPEVLKIGGNIKF